MYTAIIIEPRKHKALSFVLQNFLKNLPEEWSFIIFHGNKNVDYINYILKNDIIEKDRLRITLINLKVDNLTICEYNNIFKRKKIYHYIPTETFLIFQTDTMIFNKHRHIIYDFLHYDYVGAPWNKSFKWAENLNYVGNGGLSLRKKSKMLELIKNIDSNVVENEDIFFSRNQKGIIVKKPEYEIAKKFSMETVFSNITFGCHAPWKWLDHDLLFSVYPEIKKLMELQHVEPSSTNTFFMYFKSPIKKKLFSV